MVRCITYFPLARLSEALFVLPLQLLYDRLTTRDEWTFFQNLILRIVRFAFGNLSAHLGQVFFSEDQAWPFIRFRTDGASTQWKQKVLFYSTELMKVSTNGFEGYWIRDPWIHTPPKTVIFYLHGGGFTMGTHLLEKTDSREHGILF